MYYGWQWQRERRKLLLLVNFYRLQCVANPLTFRYYKLYHNILILILGGFYTLQAVLLWLLVWFGFFNDFAGSSFSLILTKCNIVAGDGEIHCSIHVGRSVWLLSSVVNLEAVNVGQEWDSESEQLSTRLTVGLCCRKTAQDRNSKWQSHKLNHCVYLGTSSSSDIEYFAV